MNKSLESNIWRRILNIHLNYKKAFVALFISLCGTAILTFFQPMIIKRITDNGLIKGDVKSVVAIVIIFFAVCFGIQILQLLSAQKLVDVHNRIEYDLEQKALKKMFSMSILYFKDKNPTEICSMINNDIGVISSLTNRTASFSIALILQMIGGFIGLFILDWKMTVPIIIVLPVRYFIVSLMAKKKEISFRNYIEKSSACYGWVGDQIAGIQELKLWNLISNSCKKYRVLQLEVMKAFRKNEMLDQYNLFFQSLLDLLINCGLYIISAVLIADGHFTVGTAFAFINYCAFVMSPMNNLINIKYLYSDIKPAAERLFSFFDSQEENDKLPYFDTPQIETEIIIKCNNISFKFQDGKDILKNLDLTLYRGQKIGIVGENGTGKSTLINLILGFYKPQKGDMYFCGKNYKVLTVEEIRNKCAVISQNIHIFQTSIEQNINLSGQANKEEVANAAQKSGADKFVSEMQNRYQHILGNDGSNLSGGERQKLALARALLKDSDVWILDEATNGFDKDSIKAWNKAITSEYYNKTMIVITHRMEELENMDRILCLTGGKLEEVIYK